MLSWIMMILGLWTTCHFSDFDSSSILYNTICPILVFAFLVSLIVKGVLDFGFGRGQRNSDDGSEGSSFDDSNGSDGDSGGSD